MLTFTKMLRLDLKEDVFSINHRNVEHCLFFQESSGKRKKKNFLFTVRASQAPMRKYLIEVVSNKFVFKGLLIFCRLDCGGGLFILCSINK